MARLPIATDVIRALFAKSGNICAFPGCTHELVTERNIFVGQICHIEAANPGGPRYNADSTDEQRRKSSNLILLCYRHHKETDDETLYPKTWFTQIKAEHEACCGAKLFKVNESVIYQLENEMRTYWDEVKKTNKNKHFARELAVHINIESSPIEQFKELTDAAHRIQELTDMLCEWDRSLNDEIRAHLQAIGYDLSTYDSVPYYKNPFINRGWELHQFGIPNNFSDLYVLLLQAEVRYFEEYLKTHANECIAKIRFENVKKELINLAASAGYAD